MDDAKKSADQEIVKLREKQAALKEDIQEENRARDRATEAEVEKIEAKVDAAAVSSAAANAEIEKQVRHNAAEVARHTAQIRDLDRRLKKLEMGLDDGSVVKVILHKGTYYLKCLKHANDVSGNPKGNKRIICNTTGTDGAKYQRRLDYTGAGDESKIIPKGAANVQDTIVVKDTQGKKTNWRISFASGATQATLEKLPGSLHGGSLLENNTSNYSYIINPLNGQFVDITSRLGNKILKNYIRALI